MAIVVAGHSDARKAAIDVATKGTQLLMTSRPWSRRSLPVVTGGTAPLRDELLDVVIKNNIKAAVAALSDNKDLAPLIAAGKLKIVGREYLLQMVAVGLGRLEEPI